MEKLNKQMDDALNTPDALAAIFDLVKDINTLSAASSKAALEAGAAAFDEITGVLGLMYNRKRLLWAAIAIVVVLCLIMGGLLLRFNTAYNQVITTCAQVNEIAGTLQDSLAKLDTEQLDSMMQTLPDIADKLSQIDVDALNDVMAKLPATMDAVAQLQQQLNSVASFLGNVGSIFG